MWTYRDQDAAATNISCKAISMGKVVQAFIATPPALASPGNRLQVQKGRGMDLLQLCVMLSMPSTYQETIIPAVPQPPLLPTVYSNLLPTETRSKDFVYVALVRDKSNMTPRRLLLWCLGQGHPHPWRVREKGPVGSIFPHLTLIKEIPLGQEPAPRGITQLGQEGWREGEKAPSWNAMVKRFNSNVIFDDIMVFLRYTNYKSLQVYQPQLLLRLAGNTQDNKT